MIYELHRDVQATLQSRGYPVHMVYGSAFAETEKYPYMVRFERDREGQDTVGAPRGAQKNPRKLATRTLAGLVTMWARSSERNAHVGEHEAEAEKLVDAVIAAMLDWKTEGRVTLQFGAGSYQKSSDREDTVVWPGVRYEQKFTVTRGLLVRNYAGAARPETPVLDVAQSTLVKGPGGVYVPVV